jgi:hypothetical protein
MRALLLLLLALIPAPALAWEFRADPICTLTHAAAAVQVIVTHDPAIGDYAIALTLAEGTWPAAPAFHIAFAGGRALTIGTDRHDLSDAGRTLTVRDTGFGNVLDGIEFNSRALAWSGAQAAEVGLDGAGPAVQAFRACARGGAAVS